MLIHPPFWFALILALAIAGIAWSARWLTQSGAIATAIIGLLVFWLGGGEAAAPLIAFFVSSSLLSAIGKKRTVRGPRQLDSGSTRDAYQVIANGGAAAGLVIVHNLLAYHVTLEANRVVQVLFLAAIATVNADTWATEIGKRWGGMPRLLSNWRKAQPGASGAISVVGTVGGLAGALFIPLCTYRLWGLTNAEALAVSWAAFLGCFFDSILGAGLQGQYRNPDTNEITDYPEIGGRKGKLIRGLAFINNNVVNFAASVAGAFFCWVLLHYGLRNLL